MECFTISVNKIEGRLDAFYFKPEYTDIINKVKNTKFNCLKLGDLISNLSGGATPKVEGDFYTDKTGIPFLRVQNVAEEGIKLDEVKYIRKEVHEGILKRSQLKKDDIVFTITGRIGSVVVVPDNFEGNINQHSVRFHLKDSVSGVKINPNFISVFFNTQIGRSISFRNTTGGTRPALDYVALKNLPVPVPPLRTQNRIVEIMENAYSQKKQKEAEAKQLLDSIDNYILNQLGIKLPRLEETKCFTVYSKEITGRIDPYYNSPKFEKISKVNPKKANVNLVEFRKIMELITKGETPLWRGDSYLPEGVPFLKVQNIGEKGIKGDLTYVSKEVHKRMKRSQLKGGELLYTMAGSIGIATVFPINFGSANINQAIAKIILKQGMNNEYVSFVLNSSYCRIQAQRFLTTSAQPNINFDQIKSLMIPLPPIKIQNKIAKEVKKRMQKAEQLQKEAKDIINKAKEEIEKIILG